MRVAVVNKTPSHTTYAGLVCGELAARGHDVRYLGPRPCGAGEFREIRTRVPSSRNPLRRAAWHGTDVFDRTRWNLRAADLVLDLHTHDAMWVVGPVARVRVLHRTWHYVLGNGSARLRRARLAQFAERGVHFVTHTDTARRTMEEFLPASAVSTTRLVGPDPAPRPARETRQVPQLLFVGDDRWEKGLPALLEAVRDLDVVVRHLGGEFHEEPPGERRVGRALMVRERRVDDASLRQAYDDCDLVVLPYETTRYRDQGSGSRVLAEALAYAAPVLLTPALSANVPPGYAGAVLARSASPADLRAALEGADLAALARGARAEAPALAAEAAPSRYVGHLLECAA
ncbi:MAG: glycosyltransferase [Acidimicrobiia bacterium]